MKRYVLFGEIALIILLVGLILLDFTGIGRSIRKQYNAIDHIPPSVTPAIVSVVPLSEEDPSAIYHKDGDQLVGPTPTPTDTPTPTPTLSPEEQYIKNAIDKAFACSVPGNIAFANVDDYLSIRREPDGNSVRLGLMNPGDSCLVESVDGEWAYVTSGTVKGYCVARLLLRGPEGEAYAREHVIYTATVTGVVNVRSSPTTQAENVITSLNVGDVVTAKTPAVRSDNDPTTLLFIEIELKDGTTGYIASSKADITYSWPVGREIDDRKEQP
ncbi:MAG: SH3 domain-containing protein [Lachnospiraceae bacterium]|nr:SH3 domain-containing protein [Lachnospiraceae bacterium]